MQITQPVRARYITVFATFLAFMGIGVIDPILPIIAEQIGASHWQVELLFTAYILTMAIMMIPSGIFATRLGDKKLMVVGLGVVTVFAWLCGFSNGIPELSLFRAGWGLGNSMFFATAMTLLIALTPNVSVAVGLYEAAIGLGMAGGPLLGGLLGQYSWRYPFFGTGILMFAAFLLVAFCVHEPENKPQRSVAGGKQFLQLIRHRPFLRFALAAMFYYYGFFVVLAYSPLTMQLSAIQLGLVFFGWGLMLAYGSAVLSHRLEKTFAPTVILPVGLVFFLVLVGLLSWVDSLPLQIALVILSGLASGLNNALFTSVVMGVSPYQRGVTSGAYNFVRWLGAAIAPVLSGVIGNAVSIRAPFALAGVIVCFALFLVIAPSKAKKAAGNAA